MPTTSRLPPYQPSLERHFSLPHPSGSDGVIEFGNDLPFVLLAGPCALESAAQANEVSAAIDEIARARSLSWLYKTSFDKANRSSLASERGMGIDASLDIFAELKRRGIATITDVHEPWHCSKLSSFVSMLQIPAFLCRQTDLLVAAGETGLLVNVKKGQFLSPDDMPFVAEKVSSSGAGGVLLCERGTTFGYNRLVVDMAGLWTMRQSGYPVVMDATHSVQRPGGRAGLSGGERAHIPALVRAACAIGVAGIFIETHPDPDKAPSDGKNMLHIKDLPSILDMAMEFDELAKKQN